MKKIVFIGGHHNSALVVAKALKKKGYQVYWFGHKHTMRKDKSLSLEFLEVTREKIPFFELKTGKFYRAFNPLQLIKVIWGLAQSFYLLLKIKPQLVVSFGGYLSFPVCLSSFLLRIPFIIHEQTTRAGLANRILASGAKKILLTWSSSRKYFPQPKTLVIGLPLSEEFFSAKKPKPLFKNHLPTILVTGGKQGSHIINKNIEKNLEEILSFANLVHQTGANLRTKDFSRLKKKRSFLSPERQSRYLISKFFFEEKMIQMFKRADLVISRAGAHTVYQLAVLQKASILIPLPWAYNQEQEANALVLKKSGQTLILPQSELKDKNLLNKINYVLKNLDHFRKKKLLLPSKAAQKMTEVIKNLVNS